MSFHPRFDLVNAAQNEIGIALLNLFLKHDLTHAERAKILTDELASIHRNQLRKERHPRNPSKGADEA